MCVALAGSRATKDTYCCANERSRVAKMAGTSGKGNLTTVTQLVGDERQGGGVTKVLII